MTVNAPDFKVTVEFGNANPVKRTLDVNPSAPITVNVLGADMTKTLDELAQLVGRPDRLESGVFRLTLEGGEVTKINEMARCSVPVTTAPESPSPTLASCPTAADGGVTPAP